MDRLRLLWIGAGLTLLIFVPAYCLTLTLGPGIPRDGTSLVVGRDFLNIWMYGRAAWQADPARYYDMPTYLAALGPVVGAGYPGQLWSYPPVALLIAAPFGLLPYLPALLLWTASGIVGFAVALRLWTRDWRIIALLLVAPAALIGIMSGQFALLAAAILLTVLRWRESRPWLAGALVGLLLVKPQLALLIPLLFVATGNWRAFAAAALSSLTLAALVALIWGIDIWQVYVSAGIANQSLVLSDPDHLAGPFMPTLFMNLRAIGVPIPVASALQMALALLAAALVWRRFRQRPTTCAPIFCSSPVPSRPPPICSPMTRWRLPPLRCWRWPRGRGGSRLCSPSFCPCFRSWRAWPGCRGRALSPFFSPSICRASKKPSW